MFIGFPFPYLGLELNKQLSIVSMSTVLQPFINDLNSATELLQVDTRGLLAEVSDNGVALVLRGDLSPLNTCGSDGVPPIGVPPVSHHSSAFSESWGKILGLVAAPLVGNAATVPSLQKRAVQCNAVSQSGSQSDTSTRLRVTDSLSRLRDSTGKSRDDGLSSGHTQSPTHTALSAADGPLRNLSTP